MIIETKSKIDNEYHLAYTEIDIHTFATQLEVLLTHFKNVNGYECMSTAGLMTFIEELAKGEDNENGASDGQVG